MKVLVVGSGGREHALSWKLSQSPSVEKVYCAPGNAGIDTDAECVNISTDDIDALVEFALEKEIDLTVAGPEAPLCNGIVDIFKSKGLAIFGPDKSSARLEGSKSFAKEFMERNGIPTAEARTFDNSDEAVKYVKAKFSSGVRGMVVKADGLAAGKGVIVALQSEDAVDGILSCFSGEFGSAGKTVLIEECLFGEEVSILALTDGTTILPLASSQDHKRLEDGDKGPNTGGMGAYSPAPVADEELMETVTKDVLNNFLSGIKKEGLYFRGLIYAGIMVTEDGPKVLEFNVRFGDPEVQAVMMRLKSDLGEAMLKTVEGKLDEVKLEWSSDVSICVVMASGGYPLSYEKGLIIEGCDDAETTGAKVFHAGTAKQDGHIVNNGGRVLGVTACGKDIREARANAYSAVDKIEWQGAFYRKDIAYRALQR